MTSDRSLSGAKVCPGFPRDNLRVDARHGRRSRIEPRGQRSLSGPLQGSCGEESQKIVTDRTLDVIRSQFLYFASRQGARRQTKNAPRAGLLFDTQPGAGEFPQGPKRPFNRVKTKTLGDEDRIAAGLLSQQELDDSILRQIVNWAKREVVHCFTARRNVTVSNLVGVPGVVSQLDGLRKGGTICGGPRLGMGRMNVGVGNHH